MEVIKCGLCKEEIEYSQHCRVYIASDEPRTAQRSSKRPHIGRYKLISTASSTEHISFARRLKNLRKKKGLLTVSEEGKSTSEEGSSESTDEPELSQGDKKSEEISSNKEETEKKSENIEEEPTAINNSQKNSESETVESNNNLEKIKSSKTLETVDVSEKPKSLITKEARNSTERTSSEEMSHPQFQSSFEEYVAKPSPKLAGKMTKTKGTDSGSVATQPAKNGNLKRTVQEFETYYWLDLPKPKAHEARKLGYQFETLVTEVKHMKLPPEWKIKIMVHKQEMVSVSFSDKKTPEKLVSINAKNSICDMSIGGKKLVLLGSPIYIYTIKDLEALLDIMNDVDPEDSLVHYL